jgi:hypothetical protein
MISDRAFTGRCLLPALIIIASSSCAPPSANDAGVEQEWTTLFNGRDLTGWIPKIRGHPTAEDPYGTFRVEDGLLTVGYEGYLSLGG